MQAPLLAAAPRSAGQLAAALAGAALAPERLAAASARELANLAWAMGRLRLGSEAGPPGAVGATWPDAAAAAAALRAACAVRWGGFQASELAMLLHGVVGLDAGLCAHDLAGPQHSTQGQGGHGTHSTPGAPRAIGGSEGGSAVRPGSWLAAWAAELARPGLAEELGPRGLEMVLWALAQLWQRRGGGGEPAAHTPPLPAPAAAALWSRLGSQLPHMHMGPLTQVGFWGAGMGGRRRHVAGAPPLPQAGLQSRLRLPAVTEP